MKAFAPAQLIAELQKLPADCKLTKNAVGNLMVLNGDDQYMGYVDLLLCEVSADLAASAHVDQLPPFMHELTGDDVSLLTAAGNARGLIDLLYRPRGAGRTANERDSMTGYATELSSWLSGVQQLGERLAKRHFHNLDPKA